MARIYRRGNIWWIQYYRGGKTVRRSLKTTKKDVARREKQAVEEKLAEPHHHAKQPKNPLVDLFWTQYLKQFADTHLAKSTRDIHTHHWSQFVAFTGAKRLGDVDRADVEAFKRHRKREGAAAMSINNCLKTVSAIYTRARKLGLYTGPNPVVDVELLKVAQTMPEFHTREERERLAECAESVSRNTYWVVLLGAWAGLRKLELVNTRWEWFGWDPGQPIIHVQRFPGFEVKNRKDRKIPMAKRIYEALHPHRQAEGFVFESGRPSEGKWRYRFEPNRPLVEALRKAELTTKEPCLRLRHTFASLLAQEGVSLHKVSVWMGHSSVRVTERHYAGLQAYDPEIDRAG